MVARSQTVEDGPPRSQPWMSLHFAGTDKEYLRVELPVRLKGAPQRLILRCSMVTNSVTASVEVLRTE